MTSLVPALAVEGELRTQLVLVEHSVYWSLQVYSLITSTQSACTVACMPSHLHWYNYNNAVLPLVAIDL